MSNTADITNTISRSQELTVQSGVRLDPANRVRGVFWMARAGEYAPAWWSPQRDYWLRNFWKSSDHLAGAIGTMTAKMTAIPVRFVAKDLTNRSAVRDAELWTNLINLSPGFGNGWVVEYQKFVEDLVGCDNGAFMEVVGYGPKDGPIVGPALSVAHLDSGRCTRTGHPIYPVIYQDINGARYKLHYTRVIHTSLMPSPIEDMNGVGFSAVSRCLGVAQNLIDITVYKQEKLGSRPLREVIITKGGLDPDDVADAFELADSRLDQTGLKRYAKVVVVGSRTLPEADALRLPMADLPDGFDEKTSIILAMATIALALGMDARELFPAMESGATRADALLQHLKQRGKGPGQILQLTETQINFKLSPPHLLFVPDFQDDAQDRQAAEIAMIRANRRVQDTATGASTPRVIREQMMTAGDISREQFDQMELEDGRLEDGTQSIYLFFSKNKEMQDLISIPGVDNPLDVDSNDYDRVLGAITENVAKVAEVLTNSPSAGQRWTALRAQSALSQLELLYMDNPPMPEEVPLEEAANNAPKPGGNGANNRSNSGGLPGRPPKANMKRVFGHAYVDPRNRRIDTTMPKLADESQNLGDSDK